MPSARGLSEIRMDFMVTLGQVEAGRRLGHDLHRLSRIALQPDWPLAVREGFEAARPGARPHHDDLRQRFVRGPAAAAGQRGACRPETARTRRGMLGSLAAARPDGGGGGLARVADRPVLGGTRRGQSANSPVATRSLGANWRRGSCRRAAICLGQRHRRQCDFVEVHALRVPMLARPDPTLNCCKALLTVPACEWSMPG